MRTPAIAFALGFDPGLLTEEGFQKRWAVFRESEQCKFLILWQDKRISEIQALLENGKPEDMYKLQGQVVEARRIKTFLEQPNISNEVKSLAAFLGLK